MYEPELGNATLKRLQHLVCLTLGRNSSVKRSLLNKILLIEVLWSGRNFSGMLLYFWRGRCQLMNGFRLWFWIGLHGRDWSRFLKVRLSCKWCDSTIPSLILVLSTSSVEQCYRFYVVCRRVDNEWANCRGWQSLFLKTRNLFWWAANSFEFL